MTTLAASKPAAAPAVPPLRALRALASPFNPAIRRLQIAASALLLGCSATASATTLGGPLVLEDMGSFYVNGESKATLYSRVPPSPEPELIQIKQMYVQYLIPVGSRHNWPIVLVHGGTHTGKTYETTPDEREGWATYFARKRIPVYNVDSPGRGRSGWDRSINNQALVERNPDLLVPIGLSSNNRAWTGFRIGPSYGVTYPDTLFPVDAFEQYTNQLNPRGEDLLGPTGQFEITIEAMVRLLERIGPAIIIAHSQGGQWGFGALRARPDLVKAFISIEGTGCDANPPDVQTLIQVPIMMAVGDHEPNTGPACSAMVQTLQAAGGKAYFLSTPEHFGPGNTHMMMMDTNNLEIADFMLNWLRQNVTGRP